MLGLGYSTILTTTIIPTNATDQGVSWSSNNTSIATVDANGQVTGVAEGTATITVITDDGSYTDSCEVTVIDADLDFIGYWSFDEVSGSTAYDGSGNNNDATLKGNASFVSGLVNNAVSLDGTNSWVDIPDQVFTGDFTIAAWVKLSGTIDNQDALCGQEGSGQDINFYGQNFRLYTGLSDAIVANTSIRSDEWVHYAITRSGTLLTLYVNGRVDNTGSFQDDFMPKALGRGNTGTGTEGLLDEVYLYSRELSQLEIQALYAAAQSNPVTGTMVWEDDYDGTNWLDGNNDGVNEWHSYNENTSGADWSVISKTQAQSEGVDISGVTGDKLYKGIITDANASSHRAYPLTHLDDEGYGQQPGFAEGVPSPMVNQWDVWWDPENIDLEGKWMHFATWSNNPDWNVNTLTVIDGGAEPYILDIVGGDKIKEVQYHASRAVPTQQWIRFTVYIDYGYDNGGGSDNDGIMAVWMNGTLIATGTGNHLDPDNFPTGSTYLKRAHWGLYASGNCDRGKWYEDVNKIWTLSSPLTNFDSEPMPPGTTTVSVTGISLDQNSVSLNNGESVQLHGTISPANATNQSVSWSSSNTSIATVNSTGLVTAIAEGSATITVTTNDGGYADACAVTVNVISGSTETTYEAENYDDLSGCSVSTSVTGYTGTGYFDFGGNGTWGEWTIDGDAGGIATFVFRYGNGDNANRQCGITVDGVSEGNILFTPDPEGEWNDWRTETYSIDLNAGSNTIRLTANTAKGGPNLDNIIVTTVGGGTTPITGVSLNQSSLTLDEGQSAQLTETVSPSDATDKSVSWSSSNTTVATVDATGLVSAVAEGSATITATTTDGGYTADCAVTVSAATVAVTGVSLDQTNLTLDEGQTAQLTETVSPSNATDKSVSWSSSNTSIATVNSTGLVTAIAEGSATITVTTNDGGYADACAVIVNVISASTETTYEAENYDNLSGCSVSTNVTGYTGTGYFDFGGNGTWGEWTIDGDAGGTATFVFRYGNGDNANRQCGITVDGVSEGNILFTPDPEGEWNDWRTETYSIDLNAGSNTIRLTANTAKGGPNLDNIIVTTAGGGTTPVTGVSLNQSSLTLDEGQSAQLIETVSPSDATDKSVSWSSSNTAVATVDAAGLVSAVAEGSATITVTTSDSGYTANCAVTVNAVQQSTASESFANLNASNSTLSSGSYVGDNGETWGYGNVKKIDNGINGISAELRRYSGYVETTLPNGLNELTFNIKTLPGKISVLCRLEAFIDGVSQGVFEPSATDVTTEFAISNINKSGNVVIRFKGYGFEEVWLDDITWLEYSNNPIEASIAELDTERIEVYPNPLSDNELTIAFEGITNVLVIILDINGKTLLNRQVYRDELKLNKSLFSEGVYLIRVISGKNVYNRKLIVK
jgi:uncharacterized protein YjdB